MRFYYFIVNFNAHGFHFYNFYLILFWIGLHFSFSFEDNELLVLPFHVFSDVYISRHKSPIFFILHSLGQFISMPCVEVFESEFTYPQQAGLSMESLCFGLQDDPPEDHFAFTTANALCVRISVYILISQLMSLTIWSWNLDPTARCYHEVPIFQRGKFSPKVIKVSKPFCSFLK